MSLKNFFEQFNFIKQCKKNGLNIWQCPSFLFLLLGLIIVAAILATYFIASFYEPDPLIVAFIVLILSFFLFVIGFLIIKSFENLADANRRQSEFISIASHELRSPLTNINWILSVLLGDKNSSLSSYQLEDLRVLKENNKRMVDLVNDLLVVSRIQQGKIELKPENFDLEAVAKRLIQDYQPYAKASNVSLKIETEGKNFIAFSDPMKIRLCLEHLLDNAIRYSRPGGWVEIKIFKKNNKFLRCEVEDNGVGIPKKDLPKVFQKFFRSQNVLRYQTQGTGLGLYIVKMIIENSKGKVGFLSKEDKGSLFWFEIPQKS